MDEEFISLIDKALEGVSLKKLEEAFQKLRARYRNHALSKYITENEMRLAYLLYRVPATSGVIARVLKELPEKAYDSLLDLGSGSGSSLWALKNTLLDLNKISLMDQDLDLINLGKTYSPEQFKSKSEWILADLLTSQPYPIHSLVLLSYVLTEVEDKEELLEKVSSSFEEFLIIIEPGTPVGYQNILKARNFLLKKGFYIVAPCPHANACPLTKGDWCHFSQRISRTSMHRHIKQGKLGYEDEKYSYLIVSKKPYQTHGERILRHLDKHKGHVQIKLCTSDGVKEKIVSKKDKEHYKKTKKLSWGDLYFML